MTNLQCQNCGYIKSYFESDIIYNEHCPMCKGKMILAKKELGNIVEQGNIIKMEQQIKELGHSKVWETIEKFSYYKTRLAYRRLFFKAGGIVPKSNI